MNIIRAPLLVMTSDRTDRALPAFFWLLDKYAPGVNRDNVIVAGFRKPPVDNVFFISLGDMAVYPKDRWSDAFRRVLLTLQDSGHELFWFMMDDFWLYRQADIAGVAYLIDYMERNPTVLKIDLGRDRLFANGGTEYLYNQGTYGYVGHLDLIKSSPNSEYHMSLWGGLWRIELLLHLLVPGESAQDLEIAGSSRLSTYGDDMLVLGTRQGPVMHANVIQAGRVNPDPAAGFSLINQEDRRDMSHVLGADLQWVGA